MLIYLLHIYPHLFCCTCSLTGDSALLHPEIVFAALEQTPASLLSHGSPNLTIIKNNAVIYQLRSDCIPRRSRLGYILKRVFKKFFFHSLLHPCLCVL